MALKKRSAKAPKKAAKAPTSGRASNGAPSERAVRIPEISVFSELPFKLVGTIGGQTTQPDAVAGTPSDVPKERQATLEQSKAARPSKQAAKKATKSSKHS